ncbi:hypothetical protein E6C50_13220 [Flavobacterium supellecticarium]|uniref:HEAT repeat domain-containing protein n=1 Tax=Flavobacterium supellecticarium TaxID=2565924 RepID=A0A4S3ZTX4_9FLAO|nr:hypothetical protein [Flavobacterium supellecticarium]THF49196.1 hypothetical protein E6C50_13220 [Flavobacterium supellecticarium]
MIEYENFEFFDKSEIEKLLKTSSEVEIPKILIGAVNGINDVNWLQDLLMNYVENEDYWISKTSIGLFGDLARIFGKIDKNKILKKLKSIERQDLKYIVDEVIEDIEIFCQ